MDLPAKVPSLQMEPHSKADLTSAPQFHGWEEGNLVGLAWVRKPLSLMWSLLARAWEGAGGSQKRSCFQGRRILLI